MQRPMCALVQAIGIGIGSKGTLEPGFYEIAKGMMNHPISKGRSGNETSLGLVDIETGVGSGMVGLGLQFPLEFEKIVFQTMLERGHIGMTSFALAGLAVSQLQVIPGSEVVVHG